MSPTTQQAAERVVIIGSGPAAWTAAIYAARANLQPVVFEGVAKQTPSLVLPGGQLMLTTEIENFPGFPQGVTGPELMELMKKQALRFAARVRSAEVVRCNFGRRPFEVTDSEGQTTASHAVIIATGATANWLGLENEMRLARSGGGVSACAVCDGALPVFRGQPLAVVGGGDTAMEEASYLSRYASKVYIIHRRDELRASKLMQKRVLENPKCEVVWNSVVVDVLGADKVEGVRLKNVKSGEHRDLACRGVFVAIGHTPATGFLNPKEIELDAKGYVVLPVPHRSMTSVPGVFAAGDAADSVYRQAITAAGMGCRAALDAERWLTEEGLH